MTLPFPRTGILALLLLLQGRATGGAKARKYGVGVPLKDKLDFIRAMTEARLSAASREFDLKNSLMNSTLTPDFAAESVRRRLDQADAAEGDAEADAEGDAEADGEGEDDANRKWYYNSNYDGVDDAFHGDLDNPFGFDATQYSVKYVRCAEVKQYSDYLAAEEDAETVFETKHFAVFRFCPAKTCKQAENDPDACSSNYGEYMIELSDFLEIMAEYRQNRYENYCTYCEECMYKEYLNYINSRGLEQSEEAHAAFLAEEEANGTNRRLGHACDEYEACQGYSKSCNGDEYEADDDMYFDASDYLECTEYEANNGRLAYIAPHCAEDGETITLGVYSDQYCSQYIGDGVDVSNFLGEEITNETLKYYYDPEEQPCISCKAKDDNKFVSYANDYDDDDGNYGADVNEVCYDLYESSARCDQYFRSYDRLKYTYYNVDQMKLACDFIDSVVMGNYDQYGEIKLSNDATEPDAWFKDNLYYQEYEYYASEVTPGQIFGLIASSLACVILSLWSCALYRSLHKKEPWKFRRSAAAGLGGFNPPNKNSAEAIARQNSGIVLGRSMSGGSQFMT